MEVIVLRCKPLSCFHFGKYAPDTDTALNDSSEIMHSDTLFSAIINTYNDLFDDTDSLVSEFEKGNVRVSSAFYCLEINSKYCWFLPKPVSFDMTEVENYKSFRKVKYISKSLWESLESPTELVTDTNIVILQNQFALLKRELPDITDEQWGKLQIYNMRTLPKVHIRKLVEEGGIYQLGIVEIADNCQWVKDLLIHFYFLLQTSDSIKQSGLYERLRTALQVLAKSSIGGEKSTIGGLDGMIPEDNQTQLPWELKVPNSQYNCTMSLLSPNQHEMEQLLYYKTGFRGGRRIGTGTEQNGPFHLKSIRMIYEGAIVKEPVTGYVHNITPDNYTKHVFKRNGIALSVPVKSSWMTYENE